MQRPISLLLAALCGLAAALLAAVAWGAITAATSFQIGYMAIGVGFAVAFAVRLVSHGDRTAAYISAALSLFGCLAGNYLAAIVVAAQHQHADVAGAVFAMLPMFARVLQDTFSPMDLVFYAIGVYFGYKYALAPRPARVPAQTPSDM